MVRKNGFNHEAMLELYKCEIRSHGMACDITYIAVDRKRGGKEKEAREKGESGGIGNVVYGLTEALS